MRTCVSGRVGRLISCALPGAALFAGMASVASAQTTVVINHPTSQVVWATLRGGSYANQNDQSLLATRSADDLEFNRHALLKFDTQNTIPAGSAVTSALLTVTVKTGNADASRSIGVYQVTTSWTETEVTWNNRRSGQKWTKPGGDLGSKLDDAVVGNAAGTKVTFDVTSLVKAAVAGSLGSSRYTRVALVDLDGSTTDSYRVYALPTDPDTAARPVLTVKYGASTASPTTATTGSTLRVLHWNTHHGGVGSDGVLNQLRLMTWVAKFKPDVVSLNEVERFTSWGNIDGPLVLAGLLKQLTGKTWYYRFATLSGASTGIGNVLLSRFPIDASEPRLLSHGRSAIDVTIHVNGRLINFSTTHLHPDSSSYRMQEIGELTAWEKGLGEQRIIAGDFNATYTSAENALMKQTYCDSWGEAQAGGTAVAYSSNPSGNTRNGRIDFIYYSRGAAYLVLKSSQVYDTRDANGVTPSDHKPLMSIFTVK